MMLSGKKIVIIGGSGGIGLAAVKAFIDQGARVMYTGLEAAPAENLPGSFYLQSDSTHKDALHQVIQSAHRTWGKIDGWYHIAGGSGRKHGDGPLHAVTEEGWAYTLTLNLTSVMLSNQAIIQYWLDHRCGGTILNTGSVLAAHPAPHLFATHAYAAAKAGIEGFSKSIAAYYAKDNIRINVLAPGLIATNMSLRAQTDQTILDYIRLKQPLDGGRMGSPEDVVGAALYFMSDLSRFVTGQVIGVDGGWSVSEGGG